MNQTGRIKAISAVFLCLFITIVARLFNWQILNSERLSAQADGQHFYSLIVPANRGEIRFSDSLPLVSNKNSFLLYANLTKISDAKESISQKLAQTLAPQIPFVSSNSAELSIDDRENFLKSNQEELVKKIFSRLNDSNGIWVNLAHFVSRENKNLITKFNISGLGFANEQTRDYPESSMAAHIVGFVGADRNGNPKGYFGLEGHYERELSGKPGETKVEKDAFGRPIAIGQEERQEAQNGHDLITTLDRSVQSFVESNLKKGISDWKAKGGTAIVSDPNTGAVLAMASFPSFDPDNFSYYPTTLYKNPAVADLYEPGSIIKPLVMSAAINEGKVTPETRCDRCGGPRPIGGYFVHTFNDTYHPNLTMTETLVNSDNTGMIFVGEKLGFEKLYAYIQKFGFGQKSGVDLEEEEGGTLRASKNYYAIDKATLTFGQGILVNALQMVRGFSAIANGGNMVTPHVVSQIIDGPEKIDLTWKNGPQVITSGTARTISEMMVQVCEKSPTHFPRDRIKALADFRIACKSGTAQIAVAGSYKEKGTTASVIGFFPSNKPKYLVYVKLDEPELRPWGSDTAGPVFFSIVSDLINYYGITP